MNFLKKLVGMKYRNSTIKNAKFSPDTDEVIITTEYQRVYIPYSEAIELLNQKVNIANNGILRRLVGSKYEGALIYMAYSTYTNTIVLDTEVGERRLSKAEALKLLANKSSWLNYIWTNIKWFWRI